VAYLRRMPRDTLTRERIVEAAIDLLDTEGLEGLSMRALGERLGSAATAVYWHVGSKDDLITLAGDRAWNEVALPDLAAVDWRTAATRMATDLHAMLTRHPWLVQAFGSYVVFGPGKARHDDHAIAVYEAAGFTAARADQAMATVFTFVLGSALGPAAVASLARKLGRDGGNAAELLRGRMAEAREVAARLPRLRARLDTAAADYGAAPADSFEFGLQAVLDGLEAQLTSGRPPAVLGRAGEEGEPGAEQVEGRAGTVGAGDPVVPDAPGEVRAQLLAEGRRVPPGSAERATLCSVTSALELVAAEELGPGPAIEDPGELPAEVVAVVDGGVHAGAAPGGDAVRGVADQEGPAAGSTRKRPPTS
jgi:AcrR family transcriptional regulator